ncbi:tRNA (adenine(58)-N(1))-methyltransferase non-catalytic subunit TRM6 isoform X2 [Poeciliopsis prolifica]|nr:tRNA (adenine(58)-N(1))-methyltransferase non-catalytic subunit TRM6 isoform X2 [Poeciliopsis prolifica]
MKEQGLKNEEIIQQLIDNSSTFNNKTEYAQDKYIKKKKKKYENTVTVLKPTCRVIAMMYHGREPGKICHLRYDTLAQMLTLGNIHAGSKVLVFETCAGLVLGAIMERMGGYGSVIQMYPGGGPVRAGVECFGFPAHFHDMLHEFPICHVNALLAGTLDTSAKDPTAEEKQHLNAAAEQEQIQPGAEQQEGSPAKERMETNAGDGQDREKIEKEKRQEAKAQERKVKLEEKRRKLVATAALLEGRNADGLVIASQFHPCSVLLGLIKFLSPSRPFVVFSQFKETLIECYTKLKEQGGTVNLMLTDTWLRHYQVLPDRTHPLLLMSGGGGYLLSGTTVATDHSEPAAEEPAPKRQKVEDS